MIKQGLAYFFRYFKSSAIVAKGALPLWDPRPLPGGGKAYRPGDYAKSVGEGATVYRLLGQAVFRRENVSCSLAILCLAGKS